MKPAYFLGMEEMLTYFEGVTMAVVNYSPADTGAICNELQMLGASVRERRVRCRPATSARLLIAVAPGTRRELCAARPGTRPTART